MTSPAPPLLLTIPEACRALSISRASLYRAVAAGLLRLTPIGKGRNKRVHIDDLEAYARRQREAAES